MWVFFAGSVQAKTEALLRTLGVQRRLLSYGDASETFASILPHALRDPTPYRPRKVRRADRA